MGITIPAILFFLLLAKIDVRASIKYVDYINTYVKSPKNKKMSSKNNSSGFVNFLKYSLSLVLMLAFIELLSLICPRYHCMFG